MKNLHYLAKVFYLDLRSLAVFRIGLGLVSLFVLNAIYPDLDAFLGSGGIAPLQDFRLGMPWGLYAISDHGYFIHILFLLHVFSAVMLTVGFKTRIATIVCFVMTLSLFNRVLPIEYGAEKVLRIFLLWGSFLPLGARFSLDQYFSSQGGKKDNAYVSIATVAFMCQLIMIYVFTALSRTHPCWLKDNTALNYGLQYFPYLTKPLSAWLLNFPEALEYLTFITHRLELYGAFLLLIPVCAWVLRSMVIVAFALLHVGVYVLFKLDPFPLLMIIGWLALAPSVWWDHRLGTKHEFIHKPFTKRIDFLIILLLSIAFLLNVFFVLKLHAKQRWEPTGIVHLFENLGIKQQWRMFNLNNPQVMTKWEFIPIYENQRDKSKDVDLVVQKRFSSTYWINLTESVDSLQNRRYIPYIERYLYQEWRNVDPHILKVEARRKTWFINPLPRGK